MRFLGNYDARLDAKSRVFIPAAFRKLLLTEGESTLYLRKDVYQNCIVIYPSSVWEKELVELRSRLNRWDPDEQELYRQFMLEAEAVEPDGSGRILVSRRLLSLADVGSDVRFLGVDDTMELWSREVLEKPRVEPDVFRQRLKEVMKRQTAPLLP